MAYRRGHRQGHASPRYPRSDACRVLADAAKLLAGKPGRSKRTAPLVVAAGAAPGGSGGRSGASTLESTDDGPDTGRSAGAAEAQRAADVDLRHRRALPRRDGIVRRHVVAGARSDP